MSAWLEKEYKVGNADSEGHYVTVCPAPDYPEDGILLYTDGEKNEKFWGKIYIQSGTDFMRKLGEALIACANDLEKTK
jgi:hypothetical protein